MNTLKNYIKRETKPDLYYKAPYNEEAYDYLSDYVDCSRNYKGKILSITYTPRLCLSGYNSYINLYEYIDDNRTNNLYWYVRSNELVRMYNAM